MSGFTQEVIIELAQEKPTITQVNALFLKGIEKFFQGKKFVELPKITPTQLPDYSMDYDAFFYIEEDTQTNFYSFVLSYANDTNGALRYFSFTDYSKETRTLFEQDDFVNCILEQLRTKKQLKRMVWLVDADYQKLSDVFDKKFDDTLKCTLDF